jgi:hypothetical protein
VNDDPAPVFSINDASVPEGDSGFTQSTFVVTLSAPSENVVSVTFSTADNTAAAGSDYAPQSATLTFSPGQTSKTISVAVIGDTDSEPDETFFVNLTSAVNATIGKSQGVGTITNDDFVKLTVNETIHVSDEPGLLPSAMLGVFETIKVTDSPHVLTAEELINDLINQVQSLVNAGVLNKGQGNSLIVKLRNVLDSIGRDKNKTACNQLDAFINEVNAHIQSGLLAQQGQALLDQAAVIQHMLGC